MQDVVDWVVTNWPLIAGVVGGLMAVAAVIVAATPTPADDAVFAVVRSVWNALRGLPAEKPDASNPGESPSLPGSGDGGSGRPRRLDRRDNDQ